MKRKVWIVSTVAALLAFNVVLLIRASRRPPGNLLSPALLATYEKENRQISSNLAVQAAISKGKSVSMIGFLTKSLQGSGSLPLAGEQKDAIMKLDRLMSKARTDSLLADAEFYDGPPADRQRDLTRSDERRNDAISHAQRLVTLGLLTEPQSALVTQRYLKGAGFNSLYDKNVAELLNLTDAQRANLAQVLNDYHDSYYSLSSVSGKAADKQGQKEYTTQNDALTREHDANAKAVLTPTQLQQWVRLTTERPPIEAPRNLPRSPLSEAEASQVEIRKLSPTFRALAEGGDTLRLTADQKKLLQDLEEVARDGLLWIGHNNAEKSPGPDAFQKTADWISQTRSEFMRHAEQVALLGILTKGQAEQLRTAIEEK